MRMLGAVLGLAALAFSEPATAAKLDVQARINSCHAEAARDISSGVTGRMVQGSIKIETCLERELLALVAGRVDDAIHAKMTEDLGRLRAGYLGFQWSLHNERKSCPCGTMYQLLPHGSYTNLLEQMLREAAEAVGDDRK